MCLYQWLIHFGLSLPFSLIRSGFSHDYFYPHGSLLVKLTDNRSTCLTNPVKNKHSLTYPVKFDLCFLLKYCLL